MDGYLTSVSLDNIVNEVGHSSSIDINVAIDPCVDAFFRPQSVAIVGATERAGIGRVITTNLKESVFRFTFKCFEVCFCVLVMVCLFALSFKKS